MYRKLIIFSLTLSFMLLGSTSVNAVDKSGTRILPIIGPTKEPGPIILFTQFPQPKGTPIRLDTKTPKSSSCNSILAGIKTRSASLNRNVANMLGKFDAILARVEDYYTGTVVPSGKTVSNYLNLVADTQTKRALVTTALDAVKNDLSSLNCDGGNSKDMIVKYNKDMMSVKSALANYRTSIKNMIVAVRGFKRFEKTESPKTSPTPRTFTLPRDLEKRTPNGSAIPFISPRPVRSIGPAINLF